MAPAPPLPPPLITPRSPYQAWRAWTRRGEMEASRDNHPTIPPNHSYHTHHSYHTCQAWRAWTRLGEMEASRDNRGIAKQILALRSEQAKLHGFRSFAE